jgi:hypothetical protein
MKHAKKDDECRVKTFQRRENLHPPEKEMEFDVFVE